MQREAANIIRRSVDSEYHEHFDVTHNHNSANDVLGSMNLKALMDKYYDLRPGQAPQSTVQELISDLGKRRKRQILRHSKVQIARPGTLPAGVGRAEPRRLPAAARADDRTIGLATRSPRMCCAAHAARGGARSGWRAGLRIVSSDMTNGSGMSSSSAVPHERNQKE